MSYHTQSIITTVASAEDYQKQAAFLQKQNPDLSIRQIHYPFKGIVAQVDLREEAPIDLKPIITAFSSEYGAQKMALIEVECFGGKCDYDGTVWQQGAIINEEALGFDSHIRLLKAVSPNYSMWHFEPFTRDYFRREAGFWGEIRGEHFGIFTVPIYTEYEQKVGFTAQLTNNECSISNGHFYFYLMQPSPNCIKVLGAIYSDFENSYTTVKDIIEDHITDTQSFVVLELIERGEVEKIINWEGEPLTETSYRHQIFNPQSLDLSASPTSENPASAAGESKGFWRGLKDKLGW